ncbi:MAG: hypothetical protein HETSPECPRED_004949 [Heterodermia speciosa]|uniref:Uncharacterized protein n=1 Tax=Heterodermia speciosa TaxID=116794 RepID=A0A8H3I6P0_9LECA|nr:MAG: hypothetical protein HETSPECPRED_004949 [Heterodermia speciosa]
MSAEAHHEQSLSPNTTDDVDSTIVSTTPTGTPRITPGLLRPVRSTHLELATPTPAPTRHSSLAPEADPTQPTNANEIAGRGFGNTDNHRASSISAISALTIPPYQLRDSDHFEMSSEDDEDKARTKTHYDKNSTILGRYSKDLGITDRRPKNWYSTPPRTPASANTTEAPTSPRDVEGMVGLEQASIDASASTPGVRGIDTESASSTVDKARHGSGSTADSGNGERRGSEARNWEEVHAARREATATSTANPVDLTSTSQAQSGQGIFRRYPSTSTNGVKSPASVTTMNRYPSTSTGAMKSPDHGDHPATPTTAGVSQASLTHTIQRYPSTSTTAMKSPALGTSNNDSESPKSFRSFATDSTGGRAERGLHVPFLPKSLRLSIGRTSNDTARQSSNEVTPTTPSEDRKGSFSGSAGRRNSASSSLGRRGSIPVAGNGQPLKSVSEDGDFMEYDGEAEINNATTAAAARPKIVNQRASSREVVGLKEILKEDPPTTTTARQRNIVDTSPTKSKFARFLGENVRFGSKRQGIVGVPVSKEAEDVTLSNTGSENDPVGLGIYQTSGSAASYADGLRSNPVRRAASTPVRSTPARRERRVTFPGSYVDVRTGLQPEEREKEKREVCNPFLRSPGPPIYTS